MALVKCGVCQKRYKVITNTHLKLHNISLREYKKKHPGKNIGFSVLCSSLSKKDNRYIKWKESLKKRKSWIKGRTKENDVRVRKISKTMKYKKIDNFKNWRKKAKEIGLIPNTTKPLTKNESLAELIGLVLGDGNLYKHKRTECLLIAFNQKYPKIINRGRELIKACFNKEAKYGKMKDAQCDKVWIYQKNISRRLEIPSGAKKTHELK